MENLATVVAAVVKSLPTKPSNDSLSVLPQPPEADRARAIYRIIAEVEMVKMINPPATDQQREALMRLLSATGRPIEEIARMGRSVVTKPTFGKLPLSIGSWRMVDRGSIECQRKNQIGTAWSATAITSGTRFVRYS